MAERTHIPGSPACGQWETLLADALDGVLPAEDEARFTGHMANCAACTALFDEARRGREWLEFLAPEPEAPAGLVDRILAHTGPGHKAAQPVLAGAGAAAIPPAMVAAWQKPGFMGHFINQVRRWAEPRLMMTAAMAFFSIALTLSLTGVRLRDVRLSNLRPTAVRSFMERRLTMASVPIIRYYDHLRLVYEVQSRMRELRGDNEEMPQQNNAPPAAPGESQKHDGGSRVETPQTGGEPSQANAVYYGDFVETALEPGTEGQRDKGNMGTREAENQKTIRQIRAFRRLRNQAASRASERSKVWTA